MKLITNWNIVKVELFGYEYNIFNVMVQINLSQGILMGFVLN
jgi:hypothetical protein